LHPDVRHRRDHQREQRRARKARYRRNLAAGEIVVRVRVSNPVIMLLLDTRWLAEPGEDREQIGAAIKALLEDAAGKYRQP
jgi:hypothetical protein